jgi:predicted nucleic acid-binding Zn ribbon protein
MSEQARTTMVWVLIGAGVVLGLLLMLIGGPPVL